MRVNRFSALGTSTTCWDHQKGELLHPATIPVPLSMRLSGGSFHLPGSETAVRKQYTLWLPLMGLKAIFDKLNL